MYKPAVVEDFFTFQNKFGKDLESIHNVFKKYVNKINSCVICVCIQCMLTGLYTYI